MPPKRILHITSVLNHGGIENLLLNVLQKINHKDFIFDFLVVREDNGIIEPFFSNFGSTIYKLPAMKKCGYFNFKKNLSHFFNEHPEYTIVHSHLNTLNGPILKVAKDCGIKTRISHAHTAFPKYGFLENVIKNYFKGMIPSSATDFISCSESAGRWLHNNCFDRNKIILNGIDFKRFAFSAQKRELIRKELGIENNFVLLSIGRFSKEKNHCFLLKIFKEVLKVRKDALLLCIGNGREKEAFVKAVIQSGLSDKILVFDAKNNVEDYYCASDVYVSPSLFEGFGVSVLEAFANGLPCIISDSFSEEIKTLPRCFSISLGSKENTWSECILKQSFSQEDRLSVTLPQKYTIEQTTKDFCDLY